MARKSAEHLEALKEAYGTVARDIPETKAACEGCHQNVVCGIKDHAISSLRFRLGRGFVPQSCIFCFGWICPTAELVAIRVYRVGDSGPYGFETRDEYNAFVADGVMGSGRYVWVGGEHDREIGFIMKDGSWVATWRLTEEQVKD